MSFLATVHTDAGLGKENNQDSALQIEARTDFGDVMLSVVCDGMGGRPAGAGPCHRERDGDRGVQRVV